MRKLAILLSVVALTLILFASSKEKEATVEWKKIKSGVEYTVSFVPDFKLNMSAPFKFFLNDAEGKEMAKVKWGDFKKGKDGKYRYLSEKGEKKTFYWFVACKYADGKIIACKTFSENFEIK